MQKKYQSKGLILVALSYESKSLVTPYVEKHKLPYIVGAGADKAREDFGINGFPSSFLIDPEGKIAWKGHPAEIEKEIEKLLKEKPPKKGGLFSEKSAQAAFKKAERLVNDKNYPDAMDAFAEIASLYQGTKVAKRAKEQISKMKGDPDIKAVLKKHEAEVQSKRWLDIARTCATFGEKQDALKYYDKIIDKYGEYATAKIARREKGSLGKVELKSEEKAGKKGKTTGADSETSDDEDEGGDEDSEDDSGD